MSNGTPRTMKTWEHSLAVGSGGHAEVRASRLFFKESPMNLRSLQTMKTGPFHLHLAWLVDSFRRRW